MKTSLRLTDTVKIGITIGVSLQLLLFVAGSEAIAQTKGTVNLNPNTVDNTIDHKVDLPLNSPEWVALANTAKTKTTKTEQFLSRNKKFDPEDNGNPDGTRGSGTRCVRDRQVELKY